MSFTLVKSLYDKDDWGGNKFQIIYFKHQKGRLCVYVFFILTLGVTYSVFHAIHSNASVTGEYNVIDHGQFQGVGFKKRITLCVPGNQNYYVYLSPPDSKEPTRYSLLCHFQGNIVLN